MSPRPTDWTPLRDSDPTPGDPAVIGSVTSDLAKVADEMRAQAAQLRRIAAGDGLSGQYVETIRSGAEDLAGRLERSVDRYTATVSALTEYATALTDGQTRSLTERDAGQAAESRRRTAQAAADAVHVPDPIDTLFSTGFPTTTAAGPPAPGSSPEEIAAARAAKAGHQRTADAAAQDVADARAALDRIADEVDHAAQTAAARIRRASDDGVKDGWWDNVKDWIHEHEGVLSTVAKWAGYVGMALAVVALFVPGLNVIAALGLAAGVLALGSHTALALSGDGSWTDVGLDVVSLATMGAGKYFASGYKIGGRVVGGGLETAYAELKAAQSTRVLAAAQAAEGAGSVGAFESALMALRAPGAKAVTAAERLVLGGGEAQVADIVVDSRAIVGRMPELFRYDNAVQRAAALASGSLKVSQAASAWSAFTDFTADVVGRDLPGWGWVKDRTTVEVGSAW